MTRIGNAISLMTLLGFFSVSGCDGLHLGEDPCAGGSSKRTELSEGAVIEMRLDEPLGDARCFLQVEAGLTLKWKHHGHWDSYWTCKDRSELPEDWRLIDLDEQWMAIDLIEMEQGAVAYHYSSFRSEAEIILDTGCEVSAKFYMNARDPDIGLPIPSTWSGKFHRDFRWDPEDPACAELEVSPDADRSYQCSDAYEMTATVVED